MQSAAVLPRRGQRRRLLCAERVTEADTLRRQQSPCPLTLKSRFQSATIYGNCLLHSHRHMHIRLQHTHNLSQRTNLPKTCPKKDIFCFCFLKSCALPVISETVHRELGGNSFSSAGKSVESVYFKGFSLR